MSLKDRLIKLGSKEPGLRKHLKPVLDTLTKTSAISDKESQRVMKCIQKACNQLEGGVCDVVDTESVSVLCDFDDLRNLSRYEKKEPVEVLEASLYDPDDDEFWGGQYYWMENPKKPYKVVITWSGLEFRVHVDGTEKSRGDLRRGAECLRYRDFDAGDLVYRSHKNEPSQKYVASALAKACACGMAHEMDKESKTKDL